MHNLSTRVDYCTHMLTNRQFICYRNTKYGKSSNLLYVHNTWRWIKLLKVPITIAFNALYWPEWNSTISAAQKSSGCIRTASVHTPVEHARHRDTQSKLSTIPRFEQPNPDISGNVLYLDDRDVVPIYTTKFCNQRKHRVNRRWRQVSLHVWSEHVETCRRSNEASRQNARVSLAYCLHLLFAREDYLNAHLANVCQAWTVTGGLSETCMARIYIAPWYEASKSSSSSFEFEFELARTCNLTKNFLPLINIKFAYWPN